MRCPSVVGRSDQAREDPRQHEIHQDDQDGRSHDGIRGSGAHPLGAALAAKSVGARYQGDDGTEDYSFG